MKRNVNKRARERAMRKTKIRQAVREANRAKEARMAMDTSFVSNRAKLANVASTLTSMIKNYATNKSNVSTVKKFKKSLNKFDQKVMGEGATGVMNFAYKKAEPYVQNKHKARQVSKDEITIMAATSAGFKTGFYKNGSRKPIFRRRKVDKNGNKGDWESKEEAKKHLKEYKKDYSKWRRKIKSNQEQFFKVLDKYEEMFGNSSGKIDESDQVMQNIAEYVGANTIDADDDRKLERVVNDVWNQISNPSK